MSADDDIRDLHRLGYAQLLLRDMGGFASFAISFSIISIITGAAGTYGYGLSRSGPLGVLCGWTLSTIFALAMAASMAEIASSIPTAGAMYHWSFFVGNRAWGWFTSWFNIVGLIALTAGCEYTIAQYVAPLAHLGDSRAVLLTLTGLMFLIHGLLCHFGIRLVAALNDFSAWYHIGLVVIIVGGVLFMVPHAPWSQLLSTAHTDQTASYPWLFMLSLLPAMWIYTGYDASAHISEETHLPRVHAPWGIYNSVAVSAIFGWLLLASLTLGIKDLARASASDNAMLYSFHDAFGQGIGDIISWLVAPATFFCGLAALVSSGRTVYSFARDQGLPGWQYWGSVSPTWRTPVYANWLVVSVGFLLVVFCTHFNPDLSVIVATAVIAIYVSYCLPVLLRMVARFRGTWRPEFEGPWSLGRWSTPVNALAVGWTFFSCFMFMMPPNQMSGQIFDAITLVLVVFWFAWERKRFVGPRAVGTEEQLFAMEQSVAEASFWRQEDENASAD